MFVHFPLILFFYVQIESVQTNTRMKAHVTVASFFSCFMESSAALLDENVDVLRVRNWEKRRTEEEQAGF